MQTTKRELLYLFLILVVALFVYKDVLFYKYTGPDFFAQVAGNYNLESALTFLFL